MSEKHGRGRYDRGCRCEVCRAAHREYMREYQRQPEVKARIFAYNQHPEVRERRLAYFREYNATHRDKRRETARRTRALARAAIAAGLEPAW